MIPLDLEKLGASFYTGNCHKWLCTPKGCALLWVRQDHLSRVRPLIISHGAASTRTDRPRFHLELDFTGTFDPSAYLSVTEAIRFLESLLPGGLPELMRHNRAKALRARDVLCRALDVPSPAPEDMIGSLAALPLPEGDGTLPCNPYFSDVLQEILFDEHKIEVPVYSWSSKRLIRIAAQVYNGDDEYRALAEILRSKLSPRGGTRADK
jgi:isopenicillin-N epimerase